MLTGFDDSNGMFTMEDPSSPCSSCISPADLDAARLAFGTDEDLLVVSKCQTESLHKGYKSTEFASTGVQANLPALPGHAVGLNQVHKASEQALSELKASGGMFQMQRIVQVSSRDRDTSERSQERELLCPVHTVPTRSGGS